MIEPRDSDTPSARAARILRTYGFIAAAREVEAGRRGRHWAAWHVERRSHLYACATPCLAALRGIE